MKAVISGYGKMGRMVEKTLTSLGIECAGTSEDIASFDPALAKDAVCIDFTTPVAIRENYKVIADHFKAAVIGTTGWDDIREEVCAYFEKAGTPMIYASNFSIGVNILFATADFLAQKMASVGGYKPHITETHHIHKLDAPSGTAKSLAEIVDGNVGGKTEIESIREGEVAGIHTLTFEGANDKIILSHEAFSREGFARGAVEAALIADKITGVHDFKDIIFDASRKG